VAGRWAADRGYAAIGLGVVASACATFVIANLGMFWLAPSPSAPTFSIFASAVAGYFPGYLLTMATYVAGGLLVERALSARRRVLA
jgi:hypothetical protein